MPSSVRVFHGSSRIDAPDRFVMDVAERASVVGRPLFNPIGRREIIVVSVLRRAVRPRDRENSDVVFSHAPAIRQEHFLPHDLLWHELLRDNCRPRVRGWFWAGVVGVMAA
jgi:hypothetical protein